MASIVAIAGEDQKAGKGNMDERPELFLY